MSPARQELSTPSYDDCATFGWRPDEKESQMQTLAGRAAFVTGGARATAAEITSEGGTAGAVRFDVTSRADRVNTMTEHFARLGSDLNMLVNVAGIDRPGYLVDLDEDAYEQAQWGIPADRMMEPTDVAAEIVHALSRPKTVVGQNLIFTPRVEYFRHMTTSADPGSPSTPDPAIPDSEQTGATHHKGEPPGDGSALVDDVAQQAQTGISSTDADEHAGTQAPASEGHPLA